MIARQAHFHLGHDETGRRQSRLRTVAEMRRLRERRCLQPRVVLLMLPGRVIWRNGLQSRRWLVLIRQSRADRSGFLMTLRRKALIPPF